MDCREFERALEALRGAGGTEAVLDEHAAGCAPCGRRLARHRVLTSVLGDLRLETAPPDLDERVFAAARAVRPSDGPRILLRVAAAVLLLLGAAAAVIGLKSSDPDYVPLDLRVVVELEEDTEEAVALEFIYGPDEDPRVAYGRESDEPDDR